MPEIFDNEVYLTIKEACDKLGKSRQALYGYINSGKLKKYTRDLDNKVFLKEAEVNKLLEIHPEKEGEEQR